MRLTTYPFFAGYIIGISTRGASKCDLPTNPVACILHSKLTCLSCPLLPSFHMIREYKIISYETSGICFDLYATYNFQVSQLCKKFILLVRFFQHYHLKKSHRAISVTHQISVGTFTWDHLYEQCY